MGAEGGGRLILVNRTRRKGTLALDGGFAARAPRRPNEKAPTFGAPSGSPACADDLLLRRSRRLCSSRRLVVLLGRLFVLLVGLGFLLLFLLLRLGFLLVSLRGRLLVLGAVDRRAFLGQGRGRALADALGAADAGFPALELAVLLALVADG